MTRAVYVAINPWHVHYSAWGLYVIVIDQYRSTNPEGKARGMSASILHTKQGIGKFLAHCFLGYNKYVFSPQELYKCLPWPSGTV